MQILIVGASARAAAMSALRAGFAPHCVDLFADRDLRSIAPVEKVDRAAYPDGLEALAAQAPPSPWIYTGALENRPDLVDRIAATPAPLGNPGATLRAVRDPFAVADVLQRAGLPCPTVRRTADGLPRDGGWLVKPLASAGGRGIRAFLGGSSRPESPHYYQERVEGIDLAAIFVADRSVGRLLGVTRQWIGGTGDRDPFAYRGSLGPWPLDFRERSAIAAIGSALSSAFGLVGLFGVDLLLHEGIPWPVEVNPRYTASVEVLEMALGMSALIGHAQACDPTIGRREPSSNEKARFVGKAIVFAPSECRFPRRDPRTTANPRVLRLADIPDPGTHFEAGDPVMTLIQCSETIEECGHRLERRLSAWSRRLLQGDPDAGQSG